MRSSFVLGRHGGGDGRSDGGGRAVCRQHRAAFKITVDPAQVEAYKVFAAEVGRESMKNEPGVRVLDSVQEKKDPTKFTILEIYESDAAYKHHIGTAHFKKYKEGTIKMVTDLQLIDCNPLVPEALIKPAK